MNEQLYLEKAKRTLSTKEDLIEHMAYGLVTESGEILDALKKHKFYGRDLDIKNLKEEAGDLCWYLYQFLEGIGYTPEQCRADNIKKLEKRYPEKFEDVVVRNQEVELEHIDTEEDDVNDILYNFDSLSKSLVIKIISKAQEKEIILAGSYNASIIEKIDNGFYVGHNIDIVLNNILEDAGVKK